LLSEGSFCPQFRLLRVTLPVSRLCGSGCGEEFRLFRFLFADLCD
jgi:hypothetical protein